MSQPASSDDETPSLRIHLETDGEQTRYVVLETTTFEDEDDLFEWLKGRAKDAPPVVLQTDDGVRYERVSALFSHLWSLGLRTIELAPNEHAEFLDRVRRGLVERPMFAWGWLRDHYVEQFGDDATKCMWLDADRAFAEGHYHLGLNLFENMPDQTDAHGKSTYFAQRIDGVGLSEAGLQGYLTLLRDLPERWNAQIGIDVLARTGDRRCLAFLIETLDNEQLSLWDRFAATRALHRLKLMDDILIGLASSAWMIPPKDTPKTRAMFQKERDTLVAWWESVKDDMPEQLAPRPRSPDVPEADQGDEEDGNPSTRAADDGSDRD